MANKDVLGFPPVMLKIAKEHHIKQKENFAKGQRELTLQGTKLKHKTEADAAIEENENRPTDGRPVDSGMESSRRQRQEAENRANKIEKFRTEMENNRTQEINRKAKEIAHLVAVKIMKHKHRQEVKKAPEKIEIETEKELKGKTHRVNERMIKEREEEKIKEEAKKVAADYGSTEVQDSTIAEVKESVDDNVEKDDQEVSKGPSEEPKDERQIVAEQDCEQKVGKQEEAIPEMPILGTRNNRGKAQPVRLMLAYIGFTYIERRYTRGPPPNYDCTAWLEVKDMLGLQFPELPYYIDGDVKLTHAHVIIRHFAKKFDLEPISDAEKKDVNIAEQLVMDMMYGLRSILRKPDFQDRMKHHLDGLELRYYAEWFGNRKWFAGDRITYVDFMMYEALSQHNRLEYRSFHDCLNFLDFMKRFEGLSAIHKYLTSDVAILWPLFAEWAVFGSINFKTVSQEYPEKGKFVNEIIHNMDLDLRELPKVEEYRYLRFNPLHPMYDE